MIIRLAFYAITLLNAYKNTIFSAKDNWKDYLAYLKKVFPSLCTSVTRIPANTWCNAVGSMDCSLLWESNGYSEKEVDKDTEGFVHDRSLWQESDNNRSLWDPWRSGSDWSSPGEQLSGSPARGRAERGIPSHRYEWMGTLCSDISLQTCTICSLLLSYVFIQPHTDPSSTKRWVPFADAAPVFALGEDSSRAFVFSTCSCC